MDKMPRKGLVLSFFLFWPIISNAADLFSSADLLDAGAWTVSMYGSESKEKPKFDVSGGPATIFSDTNAEVTGTQTQSNIVTVINHRPRDGFNYRLKAGLVRDFELEFSSGSDTNRLRSTSYGFIWGAGLRWNLTQATQVSTAFAIDLSFTETLARLDRFESGSQVMPASTNVRKDEYQGALMASRRFQKWDPYGGLKLALLESRLEDTATKERVSGRTDVVSPFVGLKYDVFDGESLVIEASFVDEKAISAGLTVKF
jgi:hypothetical protein